MPRENLTDKRIKALKPAEGVDRYEISDGIVPGLLIRVTAAGTKSFSLLARFPGKTNPTRRVIGEYGAISLEDARKVARDWHEMLRRGVDPKVHAEETKAKEVERQDNTFGKVVEDYISQAAIGPDENNPILKNGKDVARNLRVEFCDDRWETGKQFLGLNRHEPGKGKKRAGLKNRPITGITKQDILKVIDDAIARGSKTIAHNLLTHVRTLFNWAIDKDRYGLETSPCDRIKPKNAIGKKNKRRRVLADFEIEALWVACDRIGYPYGPIYKLLLLTGLRKREISSAPRSEFNLDKADWSIPHLRMKAENDHHIPLVKTAVEIIRSLPDFADGDFLFSTTAGKTAVNGFSKSKVILDKMMLQVLKEKAAEEGKDPDTVSLRPFVIHDIRRTVRTGLSTLKISKVVSEIILAHTQKGLDAVYDQWAYYDERRRALTKWEAKVLSIVQPKIGNVIPLTTRKAS